MANGEKEQGARDVIPNFRFDLLEVLYEYKRQLEKDKHALALQMAPPLKMKSSTLYLRVESGWKPRFVYVDPFFSKSSQDFI